jgi:hypothetical protein
VKEGKGLESQEIKFFSPFMGALKGYSLHDEIIMGELRERY